MKGYVLDTNVLSELMKKTPSSRVLRRVGELSRDELYTSSICIMELRFGAARHPEGGRLWERVVREIHPAVTILPIGDEEAQKAGEVLANLESMGARIGLEDVLIGATAMVRGLPVATRNVKHFSRIAGLAVESWWA